MNKLIITDGPTASGKTTFAYKWVQYAHQSRRARAWDVTSAEQYLHEGFDVVLDAERPERDAAIKHFAGRPNTEVKVFTMAVPA